MWNAHTIATALSPHAELAPVGATVAELSTSLPATEPPTGHDRYPRAGDLPAYDLTASLVAAQLEDDDTIHLIIADPRDPSLSLLVELPAPARHNRNAGPVLRDRLRSSRAAYIDAIGKPPFEGFALLYGQARLTLVPLSGWEGARAAGAEGKPSYRVLNFVALDGAEPATDCSACLRLARALPYGGPTQAASFK